jgi:hypothetical protein
LKPENPQQNKRRFIRLRQVRVALIVTIGILLLGLIFLALRYRSHEIWAFVWPTKDDELQLSYV